MLPGSCTELCRIMIFGTAAFLLNVYNTTLLLVGVLTFLDHFRNTLKDSLWCCGMFLVFKAREMYSAVLPFGTSLNLLYGGFVFVSVLCDIHSSPWLSVACKYSSKLHLSQEAMHFMRVCKCTTNKRSCKTTLTEKQDLLCRTCV